ncbi:MAG TPA: GYF domain-containing protein, partial [Polyangiaceae bacterium]
PAPPAAATPAAPFQNGQTQESKARPAGATLSSSAMRPKLESSPQTPRAKQESSPRAARAKQESSPQVGRAKQESALQAARLKPEATPPTPRVKLESSPIAPRAKQESSPIVPRAKQESSPQVPRAKQESAARGKQESSPQVPRLKAQANIAPRAKQDSTPQARAELGAPLKAKAPPLPQKDLTPQAAPTAKMPPAKPARSPLGLRVAPVWEPEDDALTVPMPPVEEALTRPLPPVMSRTPTLPGIPDTFRVGARGGSAQAENLWAVSYADDDDRELTTEELLEELRAGVLDAETLVWRQNMADWCALGDVPELARHLTWKREQPPKGEGFQVAEPERGLLYPTAYYPPPPEEEEDDQTAVFAYDAALLAAATSEYPAPPPKPPAMPAMPPMPPPPAMAPPPAVPERAAPTQLAPPAVAWPPPVAPAMPVAPPVPREPAPAAASPAHSAADRASPPPPKFKRRGGALAIMALLVVAGLGGLAWILIRSSKPPVVAAGPVRKVETPRAILPLEEKVEDEQPKPAVVDPYAVPAASASASAPVPAGSAAGDFFELFASGAQSTSSSQQDFDKTRAEKALAALAARAANCRKTGDPPGMASVVVRFDPTGLIGDVRVIGKPYADTGTARCISTRFLGARVQAFKGEPQTLVKNFMLY